MILWKGRTQASLDELAEKLNNSIVVHKRLYKQDILGSIAHVNMMEKQGIITSKDKAVLIVNLKSILAEIENGELQIDLSCEDIHTFVEAELIKRIGDTGKKLHTSRSRNDQIALDTKMYIKEACMDLTKLLMNLVQTIVEKAKTNINTAMPGYTHLQRAQVVTFAHYILAYAQMFMRDIKKLEQTYENADYMPLGVGALAGSPYPIDRGMVANELGFLAITENSMDTVSDRDHFLDLLYNISLISMHLSRFSEELILWASNEFGFIEFSDNFSTGSSIMPQKKNPDIAELVRGKSGIAFANLQALFVVMKGLPLAYNKDLQEDKALLFNSLDTITLCLQAFIPMFDQIKVNPEAMLQATKKGFLNATDCADYLTKKGVPFREAYGIVGNLVAECIAEKTTIEDMSLKSLKEHSDLFEKDIFSYISVKNMLDRRNSYGGTAPEAVKIQISNIENLLSAKVKSMQKD